MHHNTDAPPRLHVARELQNRFKFYAQAVEKKVGLITLKSGRASWVCSRKTFPVEHRTVRFWAQILLMRAIHHCPRSARI